MTAKYFLPLTLAITALGAEGKVSLPNYITDNMIVQQNSTLTLKGSADPGSKVTVRPGWSTETITTGAGPDGAFSVAVPTPAAGGPYTLKISDGKDNLTLSNILSGEVWLCSGQSNMEFPVSGWTSVTGSDEVIATAQHPDIRMLQVTKQTAFAPQDDCRVNMGGWVECSSATVPEFSAIAYLYALELLNELKVPIGVIDATWGGTPVEAWSSLGGLKAVNEFAEETGAMERCGFDAEKLEADYAKRIEDWRRLALTTPLKTPADGSDKYSGEMPTGANWENTVLPSTFDGIVKLNRTIDIPQECAGAPLTLYLGALDDEDVTLFNGSEIGRGSGFDRPRVYTVPAEMVKPGKTEISIQVTDFGGGGGFNGGDRMRAVSGDKEISLEGNWNYTVQADFRQLPPKPMSVQGGGYPTVLYNAMIHPLAGMPLAGVIWYQGCANVGHDKEYAKMFPQMIKDWRTLWNSPDMPFNFVQLAGWLAPSFCQPESEWAALRNAQTKALELDNTAMAVAIDLGNPADIHPRNKQDVAHRLALIAKARQYGRDVEYKAPAPEKVKTKGNKITVTFDKKVVPTSCAVTGFIVAGKDGKYYPAAGRVVDDTTIELSSADVASPVNVRYDWADYPGGNLYGETKLPVSPFATDK